MNESKHGLPLNLLDVNYPPSVFTGFQERINKNGQIARDGMTPCWEWTGGIYKKSGYGRFWVKHVCLKPHRIQWVMHFGEIPKSMMVCHKCDVRHCVNPEHLFMGKGKDNMDDMVAKGRANPRSGENHPSVTKPECVARGEGVCGAKLTPEKIIEIRKLYASGFLQKDIAILYDIDRANVSYIVNRKSWAHVP